MRDDWDLLRDEPDLHELLANYAKAGLDDRQRWLDRQMALDDHTPKEVARLHGDLLAYDWLEQATGQAGPNCSGCYRVTMAGRRALRQAGPGALEE